MQMNPRRKQTSQAATDGKVQQCWTGRGEDQTCPRAVVISATCHARVSGIASLRLQ